MSPIIAHLTGIPHGDAAEFTAIGLWPIFVATAQVCWFLIKHHSKLTWANLRRVATVSHLRTLINR